MKKRPLNGCIFRNEWRSFILMKLALLFLLACSFSFDAKGNEDAGLQTQQGFEVRGTVTDTQGETLVGVNVIIQGTTTGTVTGVDGTYTIRVPNEQAVLQFSYVGHQTRSVAIGNQRVINVVLSVDLAILDEIVVVGYSTRRQSELSSSVAVVSEEELRTAPSSASLNVMLQGRVPGLEISGTSGAPGSSATMLIRGRGSIGAGNSPLFVVDGIIGGSYHPQDVASVTVLKDAAATGLYGSRASNGVIVITTRSGQPGEFRVSVNSSVGPTFEWNDRFEVHNTASLYEQHSKGMKNLYDMRVAEGHPSFVGITFEQFRDNIIPPSILDTDTDWPSLLIRPGFMNQHNISMSGGNERTTFFLSGNYNHEKGTSLDQYYQRATFRANVTHKISDKFTTNVRLTANYGHNPYYWGSYARTQAFRNMPYDNPYHPDGITKRVHDVQEVPIWYYYTRVNYMNARENAEDLQRSAGTQLHGELNWQINDWARFNTSNRVSYSGRNRTLTMGKEGSYGHIAGGYAQWDFNYGTSFITSNTLHTTHRFGSHSIFGILGQEYTYSDSQFTQGVGWGLVTGMSALSSTSIPNSVTGDRSETGFKSYFGQLDYNYLSKYFLVGSLRRDASSVFGADFKWGNFYSIGANWLISRESFLSDVDWLDVLKLRVSYGSTGNANISDYLHLGTYRFTTATNYAGQSGAQPSRLPNPLLSWETAYTANIGVEIGILRRATLEIDLYRTINEDLLQSVPLPAASGFSSQQRNVGSMRNHGIDININTVNTEGALKWHSNLNFNINRNKVLKLFDGQDIISAGEGGGHSIIREGLPYRYWYMREWAGVDPDNGDPLWYRWEDEEGGIIHGVDKVEPARIVTTNNYAQASLIPIATAYPDFTGGFRNDLSYKNFSLIVLTNFAYGQTIQSGVNLSVHDVGSNREKITKWQKKHFIQWEKPGDQATLAKLIYGDPMNSRQASSFSLYDASYLKIQSVRLGYSFPQRVMGMRNLDISFSVDNLAIITKFPFGDSDTSFDDGSAGPRRYRPTRKFLFNIRFDI